MAEAVILGSTDATIAVAEAAMRAGIKLAAVVSVPECFSISYSRTPVRNARYVDMAGWAQGKAAPVVLFSGYDALLRDLADRAITVCLAAGWYHMIPRQFRGRFQLGCIGFHASLLPQLRGGAPLNWAILAGLPETGVTMLQLGNGVDDGPIYGQMRFPIRPRSTIADLVAASTHACSDLVGKLLPGIIAGDLTPTPQQGTPSYALQRRPDDGRIDWTAPAERIDRLVRATGRPYPGAFTSLEGQCIRIWQTELLDEPPCVYGMPGQIVRLPGIACPCVVTGDAVLAVSDATDEQQTSAIALLLRSSQKRFSWS
jgi:methionyl-tRNA formyltransferase